MRTEDIIRLLTDEGYEAVDENGVPMILLDSGRYGTKEITKIKRIIKRSGWQRSYGVRLNERSAKGVQTEKEG